MVNIKKSLAIKFIIIILLGITLINQYSIILVQAQSDYNPALEMGTQILEVKRYDEQTWKNTVNITSSPNDWFGGDADKVGANSKITLFEWGYGGASTIAIFTMFVIPQNTMHIYNLLWEYGYDQTFFFNNYPHDYTTWAYFYNYWQFTTKEFNDNPDNSQRHSIILPYPQNFSTALNDYNNFSGIINNDTNLQTLGYSFPILSGDDLLWQYFTRRFAVASPINEYLTTLTNTLECENTTNRGNTLIFQRHGVQNYTVEVTYSTKGIIDHVVVKNSEGYIFYEITSFYPKMIFYIILGILAIFILGIVTLVIVKKIKLQKQFKIDMNK